MLRGLKKTLKKGLSHAGIDLTKNMAYDRLTRQVMKKVLTTTSNCIDVGSHDGEVLEQILQLSPEGRHFAFEPIPVYYEALLRHFGNQVTIMPYALSDKEMVTDFQYVRNAPAYSGLKKRKYNTYNPDIQKIKVNTRGLDQVIPDSISVDFIKIDVEGAEYLVLKGARNLVKRCRPFIVFEFGLGASDYYQTDPEQLYNLLLDESGMQISLLSDFIRDKRPLSITEFVAHYRRNKEYYYIAHPPSSNRS